MKKYIIVLVSVLVSFSSLAAEFKIVKEQKFYNLDGSQKFLGIYFVSEYLIKSKTDSEYSFTMKRTALEASGKEVFSTSHNGSDLSAETVKSLKNFASLCSNPYINGQLEELTIKAGTFQTCKRTMGDFTLWYIDGFPLEIKQVHKDAEGTSIEEALVVEIKE